MAADPKQVLQAAEAMESLSEQSLTAVADSRGMTVLQMRTTVLGKVAERALAGDPDCIALILERTAGVCLGPIERVRSARRLARRVEKALGAGLISISEAQRLTALVRIRRELEHDDLDQRLAEVEGAVLERSG